MRTCVVCFLLCVAATAPEPTTIAQAPEVTRVDQIAKSITATTYSAAPSIEDRDFWTRVGRSTNYNSVIRDAVRLATRTFAPLPDDLYLEYSQVGNRSRYEKVYFTKLQAFRTLVIAECIQNDGQFINAIQQAIVSYAADRSWVLPAHDSGNDNFKGRRITIDLFSSEVACELASADYMLGDRLDTATRSLVRKEVKRRIFVPYTQMVTTGTPRMWWLTGTNNWNSVCLANVTGTAMALLEPPRERAFYVATAEKYIAYFLKGFTDDGYCSEGIGYWNYGYGCFVRLDHMLKEATNGHVDLFSHSKAKIAGLFARRMEITPGQYPAFADCTVGSRPSRKIMSYVTQRCDLTPTTWERSGYSGMRWLDEFGIFAFAFDQQETDTDTVVSANRDWFKDAGILISRGAHTTVGTPVGVALKGGHNSEHHNHNDVGSYVFCVGDVMTLVDPGAEVYTQRTFSSKRYDSDVLNSFGHPVPRVAGMLQKAGRDAAAKVLKLDLAEHADQLELDLTSAYPVKSLESLRRSFLFQRDQATLIVTDTVRFTAPQEFGTAVITFDSWQRLADNRLRVGTGDRAVIVTIDASGLPLNIDAVKIDEHVRGGKNPTRIGIDLTKPVREATVRLTIKPEE